MREANLSTKIFCRVGLVGKLESQRTARITAAVAGIQACIRFHYEQREMHRRMKLRYILGAIFTLQDVVRFYFTQPVSALHHF